jgi:cell wall-associated NlpC family hydrolase
MGRRLAVLAALCAVVPTVASAAAAPRSWATPQIKVVVSHGLMGAARPEDFRADDPLTRAALDELAAGLQTALATPAPPTTTTTTTTATSTTATTTTAATTPAPVTSSGNATIAQLDARLVKILGASSAAATFARNARAAGLAVPSRFGNEVAARLLGLRTNHPARDDALELLPNDLATRAEAAFSAAQILGFRGFEPEALDTYAASFQLSQLTDWQKRILDTAVRFIGYPYIWGGTSERKETLFGISSRGGFDCSGFVWRVYKLENYGDGGALAATLRGRTTYEMSGEVPRAQRIPFAKLQSADVLFWGAAGPRSKPAQVDHMGIYLGGGWFIHSSSHGVAVDQLTGWYRDRFAWARRPLAEAALPLPPVR